MRGEDIDPDNDDMHVSGSPPHARGRLGRFLNDVEDVGITPACAGKTEAEPLRAHRSQDHPRMRGEDGTRGTRGRRRCGSPPHARGRPIRLGCAARRRRITPACAGKTGQVTDLPESYGDHPRMRGEDETNLDQTTSNEGSPPHARGRPPRSG